MEKHPRPVKLGSIDSPARRGASLPHCMACQLPAIEAPLCEVCWGDVPWQGELPGSASRRLLLAALPHRGWGRHWVHRLKYHGDLTAGRTLALLLARQVRDVYAQRRSPLPEALLPVPMHWRRRLLRGRNQAESMARILGRELKLPVRRRDLRRIRQGPAQQGLDRAARLANLAHCLVARQGALQRFRHLAIVDDVYTTGATTLAVADVLSAAGLERIDCWCATYTEPGPAAAHPNPSSSSQSSSNPK